MIPQVSGPTLDQITVTQFPSFTYLISDEQIVGNVDGIESIQQAIWHVWNTERYSLAIYSPNYGIELKKYKGRTFEFFRDTIQKTLRDALLQDDRIIGVNVTNVTKTSRDSALVEFTVTSDRGTFGMEVEANGIL